MTAIFLGPSWRESGGGGRLFALGGRGRLQCLELDDGARGTPIAFGDLADERPHVQCLCAVWVETDRGDDGGVDVGDEPVLAACRQRARGHGDLDTEAWAASAAAADRELLGLDLVEVD